MNLTTNNQISVSIESLVPSNYNSYEITDIEELKGSIRTYGLLTPLSVIGPDQNGKYIILAGERRYTALKEINSEDENAFESIPCYLLGSADMNTVLQQLIIEASNLDVREIADINSHRFNIVKLLKSIESDHSMKDIVQNAGKFMQCSDRYKRMYRQIFDSASDDLLEYARKGNIKITDAAKLSSLPKEVQNDAVERLMDVDSRKEQDLSSREASREKNNIIQEFKNSTPKKKSFSIDELEDVTIPWDKLVNRDALSIDTSGELKKLNEDNRELITKNYQNTLDTVVKWAEKIVKKETELSDEEWEAVRACQKVAEKYMD